jgi:hypothetical protein
MRPPMQRFICLSVCLPVRPFLSHVRPSASQPATQPIGQAARQPVCQSVCLSDRSSGRCQPTMSCNLQWWPGRLLGWRAAVAVDGVHERRRPPSCHQLRKSDVAQGQVLAYLLCLLLMASHAREVWKLIWAEEHSWGRDASKKKA